MKIVIQRVAHASVQVQSEIISEIKQGFLVLLGVEQSDSEKDIDYLVKKLIGLRVFEDEQGKMNLNISQIDGQILIVSQFTLFADYKKGNRPSFIRAARPELAIPLYELFCEKISELLGKSVQRGIFGADMKISLINDGPVTIIMDSNEK